MSAFEKALSHSKKIDIDECEVIFVNKKITTIRITDSEIAEIKQNFDETYGIRLIQDKKISSIQTTNSEDIVQAIDKAASISGKVKSRDFWGGLPSETNPRKIQGCYDEKLEDISGSKATDIALEMLNSANHDKVTTITGSLNVVSEKFQIENSNGLSFEDKATYISGIINAESEKSTVPVSGIGHNSCRTLNNFFPSKIGNDAKNMCIESINPQKVDSGDYSIIFEPYSVGELLAFVVASNFNFKTVSEKKSCFSDKLQEKIAVNQLNLIDDPHHPDGIGSKGIDDEGIPTEQNHLIENGIFKNTYSNLFDSYKESSVSTGNASRPDSPMGRSSEPIPMSAPHNLKIEDGDTSQEDMIKDTKHGLLVSRLWYTYAVNPIKGDFSCTARSGIRIIENGEIKSPGKSVRIIHNLKSMLNEISAIGNNSRNVIQWASLPSIVPSLKAENISAVSI